MVTSRTEFLKKPREDRTRGVVLDLVDLDGRSEHSLTELFKAEEWWALVRGLV
jgi:hypothetical protein